MDNDSEEKIIEDWNKSFTPSPWIQLSGGRIKSALDDENEEKYQPETDFQVIYRILKEYARRHGKKGTLPSNEVNTSQDKSHREQMKGNQKEIMNLWIRAKNLRKSKKK